MLDALIILWAIGLGVMLVIGDLSKTNYFDKFSVKFVEYVDVYMLTFAIGTVVIAISGFTYWLIGVNR
jgi:hypothetical protein